MAKLDETAPLEELRDYYRQVCPDGVEVRDAGEGRGKGLFATEAVDEECAIYEERPLVWMQHSNNRLDCLVCCHCLQPIGSIEAGVACKLVQAALDTRAALGGAPSSQGAEPLARRGDHRELGIGLQERLDLIREVAGPGARAVVELLTGAAQLPHSDQMPSCPLVACRARCGELYCSSECEGAAWGEQHCLLCMGRGAGYEAPWEAELARGLRLLGSSAADCEAAASSLRGGQPSSSTEGQASVTASTTTTTTTTTTSASASASASTAAAAAQEAGGVRGLQLDRRALAEFYRHADSTNDVFRLAAKVAARTALAAEARLQPLEHQADQEAVAAALQTAWQPFAAGWKRVWWEAVAVPADVDNPAAFRQQLRQLAEDSLQLLRRAWSGCPFPQLLDLQVWGSVVGMFEQNNLDLQAGTPVEDYFLLVDDLPRTAKAAAQARTQPLLDALDTDYDLPCRGTAFFAVHSCANHSCCPNAAPEVQPDGSLQLVALRDIAAGEEVTLSYIDESEPREARQAALADYGFTCSCRLCQEQ